MNAPTDLRLRPWEESDAACIAEFFRSAALMRNLTANLPNPYREEHGLEFIRRSRQLTPESGMERAIEYKGEVIGTIGARFKGDCATVGYWLGEAYWGQGIMSHTLPRFLAELPPHITRIVAHTFVFNSASQALLRRCGFTQLPGRVQERSYDQQVYEGLTFERTR